MVVPDSVDFARACELSEFDMFEDEQVTPDIPPRDYEFRCDGCSQVYHVSDRIRHQVCHLCAPPSAV